MNEIAKLIKEKSAEFSHITNYQGKLEITLEKINKSNTTLPENPFYKR
ncbi:MAG: hypothetical protein ABIG92_05720 [Candidatus Omnitrophota bacterium]